MSTYETLGPYVTGELPEKWTHDFLDSAGVAIDITGWDVNVTWKVNGGTQQERAGATRGTPATSTRPGSSPGR